MRTAVRMWILKWKEYKNMPDIKFRNLTLIANQILLTQHKIHGDKSVWRNSIWHPTAGMMMYVVSTHCIALQTQFVFFEEHCHAQMQQAYRARSTEIFKSDTCYYMNLYKPQTEPQRNVWLRSTSVNSVFHHPIFLVNNGDLTILTHTTKGKLTLLSEGACKS